MKRLYQPNRLINYKRHFIMDKRLTVKKEMLVALRKKFVGINLFLLGFVTIRLGLANQTKGLVEITRVPAKMFTEFTRFARQTLIFEKDLQMTLRQNILRKVKLGTYQGRRLRLGLPVHGQRTKTNAATAKRLLKKNR